MPDFPVALRSCADYGEAPLVSRVGEALDACGWSPARGDRVLLKPNLIRAVPLACTHPLVIKGAATWLLDRGVHVTVADSPGFGTAKGVARAIGLEDALRPLGLEICEMDNPVPIAVGEKRNRVPKWGVSRLALESDALLSLPKVKAHGMMRLSLAVKNLFGTVRGLRKAWAHTLEGENVVAFAACILELYRALPPSAALLDGVTAMHVTGPVRGKPYPLGLLAASPDAMAADSAIYYLFGVSPDQVPLWDTAQKRGLPQAFPEHLSYPLSPPSAFSHPDFLLPGRLNDVSFRPHRLFFSLCRRAWYALTN